MSDDLVKRLRVRAEFTGPHSVLWDEAADRIEKLEAALHQWDHLIAHQFTGSRAAMSSMTEAAQITAALLHGEAPWPETRIERLEAALAKIAKHDLQAIAMDALRPGERIRTDAE
jgi:hypothetical protein